MTKLVFILCGCAVLLAYPILKFLKKESATSEQTITATGTDAQVAATTGSNSPAVNISTSGSNSPAAATTGNNSPITQTTTVNNGLSKDEMKAMIADALKKAMQKENDENGLEFAKEFPLGYALFAAAPSSPKIILPFSGITEKQMNINWENTRSDWIGEKIKIRLPDVTIGYGQSPFRFINVVITVPRKVGVRVGYDFAPYHGVVENSIMEPAPAAFDSPDHHAIYGLKFAHPTVTLFVEIIRSRSDGVIALLGAVPVKEP